MNQISLDEIIPQQQTKKTKLKTKIFLCISIPLLLVATSISFFIKPQTKPSLDNRYLELTVVDKKGYSVIGASVYINSNFEGFTDSFGQLRKSFTLLSNSKLDIGIEKKSKKTSRTLNVEDVKTDIQTSISI